MAVVGFTMLIQGNAGVGCATPLLCVQVANLQSVLTQASFLFVVPTLVGMCALKIRRKGAGVHMLHDQMVDADVIVFT